MTTVATTVANEIREAAESLMLGETKFSCTALIPVGWGYRHLYVRHFIPDDTSGEDFVIQLYKKFLTPGPTYPEITEWRMLALCFFAAMVEQGDIPLLDDHSRRTYRHGELK